jgi:O-acetyl-ADP-ribose deacetylase
MPHYQLGPATLELVGGNIVQQEVDAIVNAANEALAEGGGVCGAIFQAAGSRDLAAACRPLAPCPTGDARITPGFQLKARHVIHAVGPIYSQANSAESARLLASAYRSSLELATAYGLTSIAFPSISTGIFGYPVEDAALVALGAVRDALAAPTSLTLVRFVLWGERTTAAYDAAAQAVGLQGS